MYDEYFILQPDDSLVLNYHVMFGNNEWSRVKLEEYVATHKR